LSKAVELTRTQLLAYRRRIGALEERLPSGPDSLRRAAWAGLQDSVPRSALHSLHARVRDVASDAWEDSSLVQVWGLRYTAYVVPAGDHAPFTLGRLPDAGSMRRRGEDVATRLRARLGRRRVDARDAARELILRDPNELRYATLTGTVLIRWDGSRQPFVWTVPRPDVDPLDARVELARRFLHTYGAGTVESFARWAGVKPPPAAAAFELLASTLLPVRTPLGDAWMLAADEHVMRAPAAPAAPARLLPSGDVYVLVWAADRELLVPDATRRHQLWTTRVWPGAVLVGGDIVGTWRRSNAVLTVDPWRPLSAPEQDAVEAEAAGLPLPGLNRSPSVSWSSYSS
jgi:hypothetical protein